MGEQKQNDAGHDLGIRAIEKKTTQTGSTSPAGFTTAHASTEVPVQEIERWFKEPPKEGFESIIGKKRLKECFSPELFYGPLNEMLGTNSAWSFFFYGAPATGKTSFIKAFASEMKKHGYHFMRLSGSDIRNTYIGVAEKLLDTAVAVAEEHAPCLIYIDDLELICRSRAQTDGRSELRLTVAFLHAWNQIRFSGKQLIFIGETSLPNCVDESFIDKVQLVKFSAPTAEERAEYFKSRLFNLKQNNGIVALDDDLTIAIMVDATENYNYSQLRQLCDEIWQYINRTAKDTCMVLDENGNVNPEAAIALSSAAPLRGQVKLSREAFEELCQKLGFGNMSQYYEEIKKFEEGYLNSY